MSCSPPPFPPFINSGLLPIIQEIDPIYIIIANRDCRIQMQCPQGRKLNQLCALKWITAMTVLEHCIFLRCMYWCVGICTKHKINNECRIFDYMDPSKKAKLGKGDIIINLPHFIRCIPWPRCTSRENAYSQFKKRYKFTVEFWMEFVKTIIVQGLCYTVYIQPISYN